MHVSPPVRLASSLFNGTETEVDVAFFFVSYILIAGIMLLNVVHTLPPPLRVQGSGFRVQGSGFPFRLILLAQLSMQLLMAYAPA